MKEEIRWQTIPGSKVDTTSSEETSSDEDVTSEDENTESSGGGVSYVLKKGTHTVYKKPNSSSGSSTDTTETVTRNPDKCYASDPGALSSTMPVGYVSKYESRAKTMRNTIRNSPDTIKATGTTYYISENGNDANDGTSPKKPWKTLAKLTSMQATLKAGDAVLLERGGIYRAPKQVTLVNGVSYGAYGSGDKPCVYGSAKNYVNAAWTSVGTNLWKLEEGLGTNVGLVVFDHGRATGYWRSEKSQVKNNYDYYTSDGYLVLYLDKNPVSAFSSIEIGLNSHLYFMEPYSHDITIENICFKYTGGHAVRGSNCSNITVRNLEIGYIGGCILSGFKEGKTRYGNGVEFMAGSKNIVVENNWIYQIYDSGVTHQGDGTYHLDGFTIKNNLIEYCGMGSIEYWHTPNCDIANVTYEGNLLRFAGYGFGGTQRPDKQMTGHIMSNGVPTSGLYINNKATNFVIKNNVFEVSTYQLVNAVSYAKTPPTLSGNTYIQWDGKWLGYYNDITNRKFNENAENVLNNIWGDKTATVIIAK